MTLLSTYVPDLRVELRDNDRETDEEFFGDSIINTWKFRERPVKTNSAVITYDGSIAPPLTYTVDYPNARITFSPAPSDGVVVGVEYTFYTWTDLDLISYLKKAVERVESIYTLGYTTSGAGSSSGVTPSPTQEMLNIWYQMAKYLVKKDDLFDRANAAYDWRDGDLAVNEVRSVQVINGMLEQQWEQIMWDLERLILDNTEGERKAGGADPLDYGTLDESYSKSEGKGPLSEDFLWYDGYVE